MNRVNIAELQKMQDSGKCSGAKLKSAVYAAGASHKEAKDLFSGANVWENFRYELDNDPKLREQAKRKWKLAIDTANDIGLTVLRSNWNDRKDINLGLSLDDMPKGTTHSTLLKKNDKESNRVSYLPNRKDFESAYRSLARQEEEVHIDTILDKIADDMQKSKLTLIDNWRMTTDRNIREFWSKK